MNKIKCEEVIISELTVRGDGSENDPKREVLQVFSKKGELIAENDPVYEIWFNDRENKKQ